MPKSFAFYLLILLLTSIFGIVRYKKLTIPFKLLVGIVAITFILEVLSRVFAVLYRNAMPVYHLASFAELNFFLLIYYFLFSQKMTKRIVICLIVLLNVFSLINSFFLQPYHNNFPSNVILPAEISYAIFSMLLFRQMLLNPVMVNIMEQSVFWYNTAMLFFSSTMFLSLGFSNYFLNHNLDNHIIDIFGYCVNVIFYIILAFSIYLNTKETDTENER